ncbi:hypothetical protein VTK73DRAFT_3657 [Phialemonium thermophilum]|uniref:Uncharacterized protein n=1 Tax=Phialemonium thermophilum TaxID=223376 RepID=A0ABR3WXN5_9PEZI
MAELGPSRDATTMDETTKSLGPSIRENQQVPVSESALSAGAVVGNDPSLRRSHNMAGTLLSPTHLPSPLPTPPDRTPNRSPDSSSSTMDRPDGGDAGGGLTNGSHRDLNLESPFFDEHHPSAEATLPPAARANHETDSVQEERPPVSESAKPRSRSGTKNSASGGVRRLSASKMQELTDAPESLPIASLDDRGREHPLAAAAAAAAAADDHFRKYPPLSAGLPDTKQSSSQLASPLGQERSSEAVLSDGPSLRADRPARPSISSRTLSTPPTNRRKSSGGPLSRDPPLFGKPRNSSNPTPRPLPLPLDLAGRGNFTPFSKMSSSSTTAGAANIDRPKPQGNLADVVPPPPPSPIPPAIPLPPMSIPTLLQLELAAQKPSPLYIHHSHAADMPYESYAVKIERLRNFLLLPVYFERAMTFGVLACLDAWLWTFTVLPMRFLGALSILVRWWGYLVRRETQWLVGFVWYGLGRLWNRSRRGRYATRRRRGSHDGAARSHGPDDSSRSRSRSVAHGSGGAASTPTGVDMHSNLPPPRHPHHHRTDAGAAGAAARQPNSNGHLSKKAAAAKPYSTLGGHRRTKSMPSSLTSVHKADLLQGAVLVCSSIFLMNLDASRMYHFIRAQSAMKLYVIYNVLEVSDRLLSALGQDIYECLFSAETLSRNSLGRSKILLPFGMFLLALAYNTFHAVTLFYQVTTLNVAVNSYSNALLTLLISNQFVEIKSSVFKRFEKENSFQLTCADMVERFQMWIMLLIIGMRNVVEVGGLSVPGAGSENGVADDGGPARVPLHSPSILPASFTLLPSWLLSGEVLSPFLIVIGSEMIVDWIKHAYINKFNNIKPTLYSRILDILCKDYYTSAFSAPTLTRRLGLPLFPLSCLFIRASVQTYHMFLATHIPAPLPPSTQTSLSVETPPSSSPAVMAALDRLDNIIRSALGRAVYGYPPPGTFAAGGAAGGADNGAAGPAPPSSWPSWLWPLRWTSDDAIAALTMVVVFLLVFVGLLVVKLLLGMALLRYSRDRYARMKAQEHAAAAHGGGDAASSSSLLVDVRGKRVGGHGEVEVGEERRRWIYADDAEGLRKAREKEKRDAQKATDKSRDMASVQRYEMVARRIW